MWFWFVILEGHWLGIFPFMQMYLHNCIFLNVVFHCEFQGLKWFVLEWICTAIFKIKKNKYQKIVKSRSSSYCFSWSSSSQDERKGILLCTTIKVPSHYKGELRRNICNLLFPDRTWGKGEFTKMETKLGKLSYSLISARCHRHLWKKGVFWRYFSWVTFVR